MCGYTPEENVVRLQNSLRGKVLETVKCLLLHPDNIGRIMDTLKARYGQPEAIVHQLMEKACSLPPIKEDNPETLMDMAVSVQHLCATAELGKKLTPTLKLNWAEYRWKLNTVSLTNFSDWAYTLAKAVNAVSFDSSRTPAEATQFNIHELNNTNLFALKLGKGLIIEDYHVIFHEFNLNEFKIILKEYGKIVHTLETFISATDNYSEKISQLEVNNNLVQVKTVLKHKYEQAISMIKNFETKKKSKRSIDFLGSIIKDITGNLDQNDYDIINNQIEQIRKANNILITDNNAQIKINSVFEQRINNLTEIAHKQVTEVHDIIKMSGLSLDSQKSINRKLHIHDIIFALDNIREQLDVIFESTQLAKLGVIPKALLQPQELDFVLNILKDEGLTITSNIEAYEFLETTAVHSNHKIILLIKIPKFRNGNITMIQVEPIPHHNKILNIQKKYVLANDKETYLTNNFIRLEDYYVVKTNEIQNVTDNECEHRLMKAKPSNCAFTQHSDNTEIMRIANFGVLIKNAKSVIINNTCGYGNRNLTGSFFLHLRNCTIFVNEQKFEEKQLQYTAKPDIIPLNAVHIKETIVYLNDIQNLTRLHIKNREKINQIEGVNRHLIIHNTTSAIITFIIILSIIWCMVTKINQVKKEVTIRVQPTLTRDGSS
ncbi:uncharacterized protein LOC128270456 [Anopheles cruzii]|uniref:uncharacterized protein LOC128270456 n=1 Tax=Anopheles cruzii TaxID=68878 RepID=UPI0022EC821D|nr:uncharacterized protein LOC128270456 [Anopheles cruzii]